MKLENARVVKYSRLTRDYRLVCLHCPAIAAAVKPGQFVHLRIPGTEPFVLRRPFSVFKAEGPTISIYYKRIGRGTHAMETMEPGDTINLLGPLGNGFPCDHEDTFPVLIGGGYGIAALYLLAERHMVQGIVFAGGRSAEDVQCASDFGALGWPVRITTDDGSLGQKGLVTDALEEWLAGDGEGIPVEFYACGPDAMMEKVCRRARRDGLKAWVSLDRRMGCGLGACLACVQTVFDGPGRAHLVRVCREGPVFDCRKVVWRDEQPSKA